MSICKKGFNLESNNCKHACTFCINYEKGNKKERAKKAQEQYEVWRQKYIKTAKPKSCLRCELYNKQEGESNGLASIARCNGLNRNFEMLPIEKASKGHSKKDNCPFKDVNKQ